MSGWILSAHATGRDGSQPFCRLPCKLQRVLPSPSPSRGLGDDERELASRFSIALTTSIPSRCKTTSPARVSGNSSTAWAHRSAASSSSTSRHFPLSACRDFGASALCAGAQTASLDCFNLLQSFFRQIPLTPETRPTTSFLCRLLSPKDDSKGLGMKE